MTQISIRFQTCDAVYAWFIDEYLRVLDLPASSASETLALLTPDLMRSILTYGRMPDEELAA